MTENLQRVTEFPVSSGLGEYTSRTDLIIPEWRVINTKTDKIGSDLVLKHRGEFLHVVSGEVKPVLNVVILKFKRGSSYFVGKFPDAKLVCYTSNFFKPDFNPPVSLVCREYHTGPTGKSIVGVCEKACWTTDAEGKKCPPQCKENVSFILYDLDNKALSQLTLRGMNTYIDSPLRKFISHVVSTRKELYCFSVQLGTIIGDQVYPKVTKADQAMLVTFNDPTIVENWRDYADMAQAIDHVNVVTEEVAQAKSESETASTDTDDLPF